MRYRTVLSVIYLLLHIYGMSNVSGFVSVTTSAAPGTPNQQALTLRCTYTTDERITQFRWSKKTGSKPVIYTQILTGIVIPKRATFLNTWQNKGVFRGDFTSTVDIELPANHVTYSYAGTYRCEVTGISSSGTSFVTALVLLAPSISGIPSPYPVTESSRLQIDCSRYTTVANPSTTSYTWTYKGSTVSSGAVLDISSISRSQAGQYTCTATNTQGSDSEPVNVDVQYGPGSSVTVSPQGSLERVEGSGPFTATCTVACVPTCSISWRKGSTNLPPGQLSISNISRTDQGDYTCQAQNGIGGPGQKTLTLTVYYLWKPMLTLDKSNVTENDTVNLSCSVVSNPTVQMTIKNVDIDTVVVQRNRSTLSFTIQRVQCLHSGVFICSADNQKTGGTSSSTNTLDVQCSPRQDFRHPFKKVVAQNVGKTATIVADVIANPAPTFTWYRLEGDSESAISSETVHSVTSTSHQSVLEINIKRTQDYGDYVVKVQNTIGSDRLQFTLTATKQKSNDPKVNTAAVAGLVVAAVLVVVIVMAVIILLYKRGVFKNKGQQQDPNRIIERNSQEWNTNNFSSDIVPGSDQTKTTYSDLDHSDRDKQTYTELRTYQNIPVNANDVTNVYEGMQETSTPAYDKISVQTYENTSVTGKDQLYENTRKN